MNNERFAKVYNYLKIASTLLPAVVMLVDNIRGGDFDVMQFTVVATLSTVSFIIITLLQNSNEDLQKKFIKIESLYQLSHDDLMKRIEYIDFLIKKNYDYAGLLDGNNAEFDAIDIKSKWPIIIEKSHRVFYAVNYMSHECWKNGDGNLYLMLLSYKVRCHGLVAKRIFLLNVVDEVHMWKDVSDLHDQLGIECRFILKSKYDALKNNMAVNRKINKNVTGFNVIDSEEPGIVLEWRYENRKPNGGSLIRGVSVSRDYAAFFEAVWRDDGCYSFSQAESKYGSATSALNASISA